MLDKVKITTALDYASGTADRTGAILDMQGFAGVLIIVKFATIAAEAVTSVKAQQGAAANMSDAADLAGTAIAVADDDDNQVFVIDVEHPTERYIRLFVDKDATNAAAESAIYLRYGPDYKPVVNTVANAVTSEAHVLPVEGTA